MPLPSPWWGSQLPLSQAGCLGVALAGIWPVMCTFLDSASLLFLRDEERLGPRKGLTDFFFFFSFFYLTALGLSGGMWDLIPQPGIEPGAPAVGVWSLSHWTIREAPD